MRPTIDLIQEYNQNELIKSKIESDKDPRLTPVIDFYNRYPQYADLSANSVYFLLATIRTTRKVNVHRFVNGSLFFVGDIASSKNAPIASIGEWTTVEGWYEDLIKRSVIIDVITNAIFTK